MSAELTGPELARSCQISIQTLYSWIRAGLLRPAPIERTGGPGRGGRRSWWTAEDRLRAARIKELRGEKRPFSEISQILGDP